MDVCFRKDFSSTVRVCIDFDQLEALITLAPDMHYLTDHYVNYPCVLVRLSRMNRDILRDLLHAAWKFMSATAPRKRLPISRVKKRSY